MYVPTDSCVKTGVEPATPSSDGAPRGNLELSRAIHEHPSKPDGIRYRLKHDLGRIGIAIFDRAADAGLGVRDKGSLADPSNAELLGRVLEEYGKAYI